MDETTGQFGAGGSASDNQGQDKVNPMSPGFMGSTGGPQPPPPATPTNPPIGGTSATPSPPPPPPPTSGQDGSVGAGPAPVGGSPAVPPPPPKEVNVRTMAGDQESMKSSGGLGSQPTAVKPPAPLGGAKKIDSVGSVVKKPSGNKKALLIGLGIIVFLGAAAAVANFLVLPIFLNDDVGEIPEVVLPEPGIIPEPTPTVPETVLVYESFLEGPFDSGLELIVEKIGLVSYVDALTTAATAAVIAEDTLTEFYVTTGDFGTLITAEEFLEFVVPDANLVVQLEEDFTGFLYNDGAKAWPGYIFSLDSGAEDKDLLKKILGEDLEASNTLANFYTDNPGLPSSEAFSDSSDVGEITDVRYLPYEEGKASLNYGWNEDKLIVSTSFSGFQAVSTMIKKSTGEPEVELGLEPELVPETEGVPE